MRAALDVMDTANGAFEKVAFLLQMRDIGRMLNGSC